MSFLNEINLAKKKLSQTQTTVTQPDGSKYLELKVNHGFITSRLASTCEGFVVDTSPDQIPVEIIPHLYLGSQDCCEREILSKYNIKNVLSLGVEPFLKEAGVKYSFINCLDLPETNIIDVIGESVEIIDSSLKILQNILVHCNAGCSRSPALVIGYLISNCGYDFSTAYELVKFKRPCVQINPGFKKQLSSFKK